MRRVRFVALTLFLLSGACSLFVDLEGLDGPKADDAGVDTSSSPTSSDGSSNDVVTVDTSPQPQSDAGVPDADADVPGGGINLLENPAFDFGVGLCGKGWRSHGGDISGSDLARSGTHSCQLCVRDGWMDQGDQVQTSVVGEQYYLEAWVRTSNDAGSASTAVVGLEFNAPGSDDTGSFESVTEEWKKISATIRIRDGAGGQRLSFFLGARSPGCILVEDVRMERR